MIVDNVKLYYELKDAQKPLRDALAKAQKGCVLLHRFFGKSFIIRDLAINDVIRFCNLNAQQRDVLIIAPTQKQAEDIFWQPLKDALRDFERKGIVTFKKQTLSIEFKINGVVGIIKIKGATNNKGQVSSLRGQHVGSAYVDEADDVAEEFLSSVLVPTVMRSASNNKISGANQGRIFYFGTPAYDKNTFLERKVLEFSNDGDPLTVAIKLNWEETGMIKDPDVIMLSKEMTEEAIQRELWLNPYVSKGHTFFKNEITLGTTRKPSIFSKTHYNRFHPIFLSFDLGVKDLCVCYVFQHYDGHIYGLDLVALQGGYLPVREELVKRGWHKFWVGKVFMPFDVNQRDKFDGTQLVRDRAEKDVMDYFKAEIHIVKRVKSWRVKVDAIRNRLMSCTLDEEKCYDLIRLLVTYGYDDTGNKAEHNDIIDAKAYACLAVANGDTSVSGLGRVNFNTNTPINDDNYGVFSADD